MFLEKTKTWSFIALNMEYTSYIPIEEWKVGADIYTLEKVCYSKEDAIRFIEKQNTKTIELMSGPDIYCLFNKNSNKAIVTVWKPSITNYIEIQSSVGDKKYCTLSNEIGFNKIREIIIKMLEIENFERKIYVI
jgi:hypothetical protein